MVLDQNLDCWKKRQTTRYCRGLAKKVDRHTVYGNATTRPQFSKRVEVLNVEGLDSVVLSSLHALGNEDGELALGIQSVYSTFTSWVPVSTNRSPFMSESGPESCGNSCNPQVSNAQPCSCSVKVCLG
jgi:hypothetical protein